jgi:trimeric autotransporter adhesin
MYNTGVEIPKVSFADLSYSGIPINSYFMGFDLDNAGKLSKLDNTGIVTVIEGGSGGGITLTNLSANAPLTYNNVNGAFSITKSTGSTSGYLSSTDWAMFNSKQGSLTLTTTGSSGAATLTGNTLNIPQYSGGGGGLTWPAHIEYNETDRTLWVNGKNNNSNNTGFGESTLMSITSATGATGFGRNVLKSLTSGGDNTAVGNSALMSATSGSSTTAIGANALISYTTGMQVVAIGAGAMENAITATNSVAVGSSALWTAVDIDGNTAIGYSAMYANTTGEDNTAVGDRSLFSNTTGSDNVVIGKQAASLLTTGSGNVIIGSLADVQSSVSNSIVIGRGATSNSSNEFVVGSSFYQAGTIATETITPTRTWKVKINGVDYKIPMVPA